MHETTVKERAVLVLVETRKDTTRWTREELSEEFKNLVVSTGIDIADIVFVKRDAPSPALYIGKGKAQEISLTVKEAGANVVIFNNELNYSQQRNLEDVFGLKTIDRTQLILDIFASRARTSEGKIQVELAQLEYLLPRLKGKGIMLSRLGGGIGTRGPGEKKLEVDRRKISDRIARLKDELKKIRAQRHVRRQKRIREKMPLCSLVGYTNAGKTTLFNVLSGADNTAKNSLFTTLDTVVKAVTLPNSYTVLVSDTVGFLYRLPHKLIEAFKATLEEIQYADLLLYVVDSSARNRDKLIAAVDSVLEEINVKDKPYLMVFNKIDKLPQEEVNALKRDYQEAVFISALDHRHQGAEDLLNKIEKLTALETKHCFISFSLNEMDMISFLYKNSDVINVVYEPDRIVVETKIKKVLLSRIGGRVETAKPEA